MRRLVKRIVAQVGAAHRARRSSDASIVAPVVRCDVLAALKGSLAGHRAFIIGNGPSLRLEYLDRIRAETSFAANMIFRSFGSTQWRPSYYVLGDSEVAKNYHSEIAESVLCPLLLAEFLVGHFPPLPRIVPFIKEHEDFENTEPLFSSNALEVVRGGYTVTYLMLQLAWWMGVREFYIMGVDCKWNLQDYRVNGQHGRTFQVAEVVEGATSYFIKDYLRAGEKCIKPTRIREQVLSLRAARRFIEGHGGRIFNVAPDSPLEVFERVSLHSLF